MSIHIKNRLPYNHSMNFISSKHALYNYEILEKFEAGISLTGPEVKSIRLGHGKLDGAYASFIHGSLILKGLSIRPYQPNNPSSSFVSDRNRTLLLQRKELISLEQKVSSQGLTIIPLSLYNKGRFIKVELVLARGKKKHDKRETIKKRDLSREVSRTIKETFK